MLRRNLLDDLIDEIDKELWRLIDDDLLVVEEFSEHSFLQKDYVKSNYKYNQELIKPDDLEVARRNVKFNKKLYYMEQYYNIWYEREHDWSDSRIKEYIDSISEHFYVDEFVPLFITETIRFLPVELSEKLEKLKNSWHFPCVEDTDVILLELLDYYEMAVKATSLQASFFGPYLMINKPISDLISKCIIRIINEVLRLRGTEVNKERTEILDQLPVNRGQYQFEWQGKQKELLELIITLQEKGWIPSVSDGEMKSAASAITQLFDLSQTKKSEETNEINSFTQLMKGKIIKGERSYDTVLGKRYTKKFSHIMKN